MRIETPTVGDRSYLVHDGRVALVIDPQRDIDRVLDLRGSQTAVFSGGSLLFGSTGRPDLLGSTHTHDLVHHQYASAQWLAAELPDQTRVMPTHGFGSFCSATQSEATASTIGFEKATNPVLIQDEQRYVGELLAGLDAFPACYAQLGPANTACSAAPDLSPPETADAGQLRRRLDKGEWLVDLRTRTAFAAGHAPGTLNFGIDGSFATYLCWLIPWGTSVMMRTLDCTSPGPALRLAVPCHRMDQKRCAAGCARRSRRC